MSPVFPPAACYFSEGLQKTDKKGFNENITPGYLRMCVVRRQYLQPFTFQLLQWSSVYVSGVNCVELHHINIRDLASVTRWYFMMIPSSLDSLPLSSNAWVLRPPQLWPLHTAIKESRWYSPRSCMSRALRINIILESDCTASVLAPVSQEERFICEFIKLSKMEGDTMKMN